MRPRSKCPACNSDARPPRIDCHSPGATAAKVPATAGAEASAPTPGTAPTGWQGGAPDQRNKQRDRANDQAQPQACSEEEHQCAHCATQHERTHGPAKDGTKHGSAQRQHNEQQQRHVGRVLEQTAHPSRWLFRGHLGQGLTLDRRADLLHASVDAAGEIALLEARRYRLLDDALGQQIRHCAFQCLGHGDAHVVVVFGDQQQQSITHAFAADLPCVADALRITGHILGLCVWQHQHHHLRALGGLQRHQLGFYRSDLGGTQCAGAIHHVCRQRRYSLQFLGAGSPAQRRPEQRQGKAQQPARNAGSRHGFTSC